MNKKFVQNTVRDLIAGLVLAITFFPQNLLAQIFDGGGNGDKTDAEKGADIIREKIEGSGVSSTDNLRDFVLKLVNFSLPYMALAVFAGFVYAGFLYATAYGVEEQTKKAQTIMIYSVIGLVIVIFSYSIVTLFTGGLSQAIK